MLNLFIKLNSRLWKDSLTGFKLISAVIYTLAALLIFGQFLGIALFIILAPDVDLIRETYPWFTGEIQYLAHLGFLNSIWITQLFLTKIGRLHLTENRKLLSYGLPLRRLTHYLNLAGFLHPVHLLFSLLWICYAWLIAASPMEFLLIGLFILANYGIICAFKWRIRHIAVNRLTLINTLLFSIILVIIIMAPYIDMSSTIGSPQNLAAMLLPWMQYTPGGLFYWLATASHSLLAVTLISVLFLGATILFWSDLTRLTNRALQSPYVQNSNPKFTNRLSMYRSMFGLQGAKFFHSVWNHTYTKTQILLTFLITGLYIFLFHDGTEVGNVLVPIVLNFIPIMILMLFMTNLFGFENRELLLLMQVPVPLQRVVADRYATALKASIFGFAILVVAAPFFFHSIATIIQVYVGSLMILLTFLHFLLYSSMKNYEKIEDVELSSLSNPVVPASVTFTGVFIIFVLGLVSFPVIGQFQWIHISIMALITAGLIFWFIKRYRYILSPFKQNVLPQLWNEL